MNEKIREEPGLNNDIWDIEESQLEYSYPLSQNFADRGKAFANGIDCNDLGQIGPFIITASAESHFGPYKSAIDFLIPDNTPVLAAEDGIIVEIVENNTKWGPSVEFQHFLNYITVKHNNDEYSQYCHNCADIYGACSVAG
ncbi:MAG: M23 family metallopeptidase [Patescibacteria group bacterium]|nr:M23 family metallopeptidase [Patescibacteria group bacterium]